MSEERHHAEDAAAYVLGALEPDEADALERHIATCPECRAEVETLRGTVDAFASSAPELAPPRRLRGRVLREVRREAGSGTRTRLGRGPRFAFASTVVAIALAAFIVGSEIGGTGHGSRVVRASVGDASVRISGQRAELIVAHLPRAPQGRTYEVWLQRGGAAPQRSTLFNVGSRGGSDVAVEGAVAGVRRVLVTQEPSGGTATPTAAPVIVATIS